MKIRFKPRQRKRKVHFSREQLEPIINSSKSYQEVFSKLDCKTNNSFYRVIKRLVTEYGLTTTHFTGKVWNRGLKCEGKFAVPLEQILVENSTYKNTHKLKKRLIKEGIFEEKCYSCGLTTWLEKKIPIELEHKNGIRSDNRKDNLTILCPNCHALTEHYCGRNIKKMQR